jgi:ribosome-associated toxin RatA of RatAB toxin-antitoxin module
VTVSDPSYRIAISRRVACEPEQAFAVVEDIERFPEFMPNVEAIRIQSDDGRRKVAHWDTLIDDAPLDWVEEGVYERDELRVRFRALEGVFDRFDGFWQVKPADGGSEVIFELEYSIGLPEIDEIIGPILRERLIDNTEAMLEALENRILSDA